MTKLLKIHLKSPWSPEFRTTSAIFSKSVSLMEADALLCDWQPDATLLTYNGPKAWYCCEPPNQFQSIDHGKWPLFRKQLDEKYFLSHDHPNPLCRIPHITHFDNLSINRNLKRNRLAISIVSNHGGSPLRRVRSINFRNNYITHPLIDLYGRSSWQNYRRKWYSRPRVPSNYKGELPGDWHKAEKRELMSQYRFAVCLENEPGPYYFTEKFVEAVCAGCIPIYQSHPSLRDNVLKGALWLEPKENVEETIRDCQLELEEVQTCNSNWIQNNSYLHDTSIRSVYEKIEAYFRSYTR
jgi:hypothetical protein